MIRRIFSILLALIGGVLGYLLSNILASVFLIPTSVKTFVVIRLIVTLAFAIIFLLLSPKIIVGVKRLLDKSESFLRGFSFQDIVLGTVALIIALIIATLITSPILNLELTGALKLISVILVVLIYVGLSIIGVRTAISYKDELLIFKFKAKDKALVKTSSQTSNISDKVVDTSVIIDGRIVDIMKTGFLEGNLYVPAFVIEELQHIADSENDIRRIKGRRGLDILKNMQNDYGDRIIVTKKNYPGVDEVDSKLLRLAKELNANLITNDYNLNKVANLHEIKVYNINELANAMKPIFISGEDIKVSVIKEGKEKNQGIGYLDDGTMIVVENGKDYIGDVIDCIVTSVLQNSAGKMIFAKKKD